MADVVLFHHAQGLTPGVHSFAERLRAAGHTVVTPDAYEGKTFPTLDEGMAYVREVGFEVVAGRSLSAADGLPDGFVAAGFSLGVVPAQQLAQTRPGVRGALLFSAAIPASEFGPSWPDGVGLQMHLVEDDPWVDEDLPAARELARTVEGAELFVYPGTAHLPFDDSLADSDPELTALALERSLAFLARAG